MCNTYLHTYIHYDTYIRTAPQVMAGVSSIIHACMHICGNAFRHKCIHIHARGGRLGHALHSFFQDRGFVHVRIHDKCAYVSYASHCVYTCIYVQMCMHMWQHSVMHGRRRMYKLVCVCMLAWVSACAYVKVRR
jgi:hypothetical protein